MATRSLRFTVPGRPRTWQRTNSVKGRRVTAEKQRRAKAEIGHLAWLVAANQGLMNGWPVDAEYRVEVVGFWPDRKFGDVDRLTSLVMDALEGVFYKADRQVAEQSGKRRLDADNPRTEVLVEVLSVEEG